MKKLLLTGCAFVAFSSPAWACTQFSNVSAYCCANEPCSPQSNVLVVSGTTASCCTTTISDTTLAEWATRKAVESQQSTWWNVKKVSDLSRDELDARAKKLEALVAWAKTLSNHIFSAAYCDWAAARQSELTIRRTTLDQLDVALSLVKGLPTPPETSK